MIPPSTMDKVTFLDRFGGIYENSPHFAETVWASGIHPAHDSATGLQAAFRTVIGQSGRADQLALLKAHPDLAGRLAQAGTLTAASASEQAGAGLDQCSAAEFAAFTDLNRRYREKFGFPFILAVKGRNRGDILRIFQARIDNDPETEFTTALDQVHTIAALRLDALFSSPSS